MTRRTARTDSGLQTVLASCRRLQDLSAKLGITEQTLSQWKRVPPEHVLTIEHITGVSRHIQRPDIFGLCPSSLDKKRRSREREVA